MDHSPNKAPFRALKKVGDALVCRDEPVQRSQLSYQGLYLLPSYKGLHWENDCGLFEHNFYSLFSDIKNQGTF